MIVILRASSFCQMKLREVSEFFQDVQQLGAMVMSVAYVTTGGHEDVCGLSHCQNSC